MTPKEKSRFTEYKGFQIFARRYTGFPFFYAWVYDNAGCVQLWKVEREDECLNKEEIIDRAKWDIDQGYVTDTPYAARRTEKKS
jgi:hypothetical protein